MSFRLSDFVDERFLDHRRRAMSTAGVTCTVLAIVLAFYRWYHDHVVNRDLLGATVVLIYLTFRLQRARENDRAR